MIKIIAVGKVKEKYLNEAIKEYLKRLGKYTKVELIEVPDSKIDDPKVALEKEKDYINNNIKEKDYIITLEIEGSSFTSLELAEKINSIQIISSNITFIIGGSHGIHDEIKKKSNLSISFSKLTFPHQLFRVFLLEQIYRSYKILNNESYHK